MPTEVLPGALIIELGGDESFETSLDFARSLSRSMQVGAKSGSSHHPFRVQFMEVANPLAVSGAVLTATSILHVMGHGAGRLSPQILSEFGEDYHVRGQREFQESLDLWPQAHCLLLDACNTYNRAWRREVALCIPQGEEILFIGTTRKVNWAEATLFTSNFYAGLLSTQLTGIFRRDWRRLQASTEAAVEAYETVRRQRCPFSWCWLQGAAES